MKKYNLSQIMKRAWELIKKAAMTRSEALRQAWKEAKNNSLNLIDTLRLAVEVMRFTVLKSVIVMRYMKF